MSKHTPGPWTMHSGMVWAYCTGKDDGVPIAHMDRNTSATKPTERDANARLIAAAPMLLEALKELLLQFERFAPWESEAEREAEQDAKIAISWAEGE